MDKFAKFGALFLASIVPVIWYFPQFRAVLWDVSWYAVTILMLIRPIAQLAPKTWKLMRFLPWRKELGILSASVVVTATLYRSVEMGAAFLPSLIDSLRFGTMPVVVGTLAELAAIPLLVTSNRLVQKRMKRWWKPVQRLSYLYFYGAGMLLVSYGKTDVYWSMIIVASISAISAIVRTYRNRAASALNQSK